MTWQVTRELADAGAELDAGSDSGSTAVRSACLMALVERGACHELMTTRHLPARARRGGGRVRHAAEDGAALGQPGAPRGERAPAAAARHCAPLPLGRRPAQAIILKKLFFPPDLFHYICVESIEEK